MSPRTRRDDGFSLIELLVVMTIIGALASIAMPALLHHRERAVAADAATTLRNAASAELAHFADHDAYTADLTDLAAAGWRHSDRIAYAADATAAGFCLTARELRGSGLWFWDSEAGLADQRPATCTSDPR